MSVQFTVDISVLSLQESLSNKILLDTGAMLVNGPNKGCLYLVKTLLSMEIGLLLWMWILRLVTSCKSMEKSSSQTDKIEISLPIVFGLELDLLLLVVQVLLSLINLISL